MANMAKLVIENPLRGKKKKGSKEKDLRFKKMWNEDTLWFGEKKEKEKRTWVIYI